MIRVLTFGLMWFSIHTDIHRCSSIRGQLTYRSFVVHSGGEAPATTDRANFHGSVVDVDPTLLESRSSPPPTGVRSVGGLVLPVRFVSGTTRLFA